jgi:D-2-hydroxyglutarate dehydrogenase
LRAQFLAAHLRAPLRLRVRVHACVPLAVNFFPAMRAICRARPPPPPPLPPLPRRLRARPSSSAAAAPRSPFPWLSALTPAHASALRAAVGAGCAEEDAHALAPHNLDWLKQYSGASRLLLSPRDVRGVRAALAYCHAHRLGVVPQGGNTGLVGGGVPLGGDEVLLSSSKLQRVVSFDAASGVLVAEAGCTLAALEAHVAAHGWAMPLDLGSKGSCAIGGNVATNAGGLRLLRYGSLHGSVLGVEAVAADGALLDMLNVLRKDNVGYDLKQLLIGSEGTLAFITKVAVQTVPATRRHCSCGGSSQQQQQQWWWRRESSQRQRSGCWRWHF